MSITDILAGFSDEALKRELDRRATAPLTTYGRILKYSPQVQALLQQDEKWIDGTGIHRKISHMETDHIINLVRWLERHSTRLKMCEEFKYVLTTSPHMSDNVMDTFEAEEQALYDTPVAEWFDSLPLVRELRHELGKRAAA